MTRVAAVLGLAYGIVFSLAVRAQPAPAEGPPYVSGTNRVRPDDSRERTYLAAGLGMTYDTVVWLHGKDVPTLTLGVRGDDVGHLGWTTWLGSRASCGARSDLRLNPETCRPVA